ncbi:MAG TPA: LptF/LptG family permease [Candidatus Treponema faecavium]|nr:LptF/LptG family permease [Candidatus Treponema faecavium]
MKKPSDIAAFFAPRRALHNHVLTVYIVKELLLYFSIAFLFFFMIFFVNQILLMAEDILKKRVPLEQVIELITYSLPFIIAQSAPFATLVGFLMCIGRLVTDNELLILRASGMTFLFILIPVLATAFGISIVSFFVNDYLLPVGTLRYNELYRSILVSNPGLELESNSVKRNEDTTLVIGTVDDTAVSDILFFDTDAQRNQRIIAAGQTDVLQPKDPGVLMQLDMDNAVVVFLDRHAQQNYKVLKAHSGVMNVFSDSFFPASGGTNPRELTSLDLKRRIQEMEADPESSDFQINLYKLEYYKKFSLPFGSLFFAMLAMPVAVIFGKHNGQTIGLIIGLFVSVLYWAMMILGQTFGIRSGLSGFWTMWAPNILIGGIGILFFMKLIRK